METSTYSMSATDLGRLEEIAQLNDNLARHFNGRLRPQRSLTRQLVSFQANKERAAYRWYKYKEAFSAFLVEHLLPTVRDQSHGRSGRRISLWGLLRWTPYVRCGRWQPHHRRF